MTRQITIATVEGNMTVEAAHVAEHIYVHRSPFNPKGWAVTHEPTGMNVTGHLYSTRRLAVATAQALVKHLPEIATRPRIKTFLARNKRKVQFELWRCEELGRCRAMRSRA